MKRVLFVIALAGALGVPTAGTAARPATWNTVPVGHLALAGGFNGDVWVHRGVAYLGGWGIPGHCPVTGVKAIAVGRPSRPRLLRRFARFPGTTSEDVWVGRVDTPSFHGDLAAIGIQRCRWEAMGFRGLALYDVTRASRPWLLGRLRFGSATRGVHELSVAGRADGRVLAFLSAPYAWNNSGTAGDVRIADITNPRRPVQLADWDVRRDSPASERRALRRSRDTDQLLAHSAAPFDGGTKLFVSHWDAGEVFLDIADPRHPRYLGRTAFAAGEPGNAHSAQFAPDEGLFVENDEVGDFFHNHNEHGVWGTQRIFDASDPAQPIRIGRFATENSVRGRDGRVGTNGIYSVHNNVFATPTLEVVSWYSDGVRLVGLANPARPRQVGYFVPPPAADPQGYMRAPNGNRRFPLVWGVAVQGGLVYASDINSGLWVFRAKALAGPR
jgi:hypothetical protein